MSESETPCYLVIASGHESWNVLGIFLSEESAKARCQHLFDGFYTLFRKSELDGCDLFCLTIEKWAGDVQYDDVAEWWRVDHRTLKPMTDDWADETWTRQEIEWVPLDVSLPSGRRCSFLYEDSET